MRYCFIIGYKLMLSQELSLFLRLSPTLFPPTLTRCTTLLPHIISTKIPMMTLQDGSKNAISSYRQECILTLIPPFRSWTKRFVKLWLPRVATKSRAPHIKNVIILFSQLILGSHVANIMMSLYFVS